MGIGRIGARAPARGSRITSRVAAIATLVSCLAACSPGTQHDSAASSASDTRFTAVSLVDDGGFPVRLPHPAARVISLIPSATETLIAIGATRQIVGRTRYDVAPEVAPLPSVGGGVDASIEAIVGLHPDLVISWESDKRQAIRQKLVAAGIPVFILRTQDTTDIFHGLGEIGKLTGHDSAASAVAASVRATLDTVRRAAASRPTTSVFYVVFNDPPMTAGPQTFIGQLISLAGGRSIFDDTRQNWPNVAIEEIVRRDPDMLIVPVGEFKTHSADRFHHMPGWRDLRAVRTGRVVTVPADLMSRPSPSIGEAARVLEHALHPEIGGADSVPSRQPRAP